jgi:hypothetical protein
MTRWAREIRYSSGCPRLEQNPVSMGTNGTVGQEGNAVPQRGPLRGECGRWEGDALWQELAQPWRRGGPGTSFKRLRPTPLRGPK